MRYFSSALALPLLALPLLGDQITMKNGDRLTGSIVKYDGKALTVKSEYAGDLVIKWDAVAGVTSTQPLNIGLKDGQTVVGTVTTQDEHLAVQTTNTGTVDAPIASITYIRSKDEEVAYEANEARYKNPRLIDLWAANVALGYAKSEGNAKTTNFSVTANAVRATTLDKTTVNFTALYASSTTDGKASTTANAQRGGFNYELNLNPKMFVFAGSGFEADQFQNLDLRFTPGGGLGYHAIKTASTTLDLFGGGTYDKAYYSNNMNTSYAEIQVGEELLYKFLKLSSIHEKLTFFPNLTDTGNFRMNFDLSTETKLRKWLAWQVAISDRYLSNPLPGNLKNDLIITTGVNIILAKDPASK
jgi:putative salt-induced outer membrane protein